jgi:hypothetical protein
MSHSYNKNICIETICPQAADTHEVAAPAHEHIAQRALVAGSANPHFSGVICVELQIAIVLSCTIGNRAPSYFSSLLNEGAVPQSG